MMHKRSVLSVALLAALAGGCAVQPVPMTADEVQERIKQDHERMFAQQEPLSGPLSLDESLARALKYNLDHRVKQMEIALAHKILTTHNYAMLPELALSAGYQTRNNDSGGLSKSLLTGQQSLEPSTSQERSYYDAGLNLVWNVLDFGVSYVTAEQKADDVLIAQERRRRVVQNVVLDTQEAYWQAVAAQRLLAPLESLLKDVQSALERSRTLEQQAAQNPEAALNYQKRLLETLRDLSRLREEMTLAKGKLAALINLPVGAQFEVAVPQDYEVPAEVKTSLADLEQLVLSKQPELREEDYKTRIRALDVKKSVLRMFPGLEVSLGGDYNSNAFLYNQSWYSAGLRISWNLLNVFTGGPAAKREAEAHVELADSRRMALAMAVLTQVWVSYQRYQLAREDFRLADDLYTVNEKLGKLTQQAEQAQARSQLDVVLANATALASQTGRAVAYANVRSSLARIYHSVGLDPLSEELMAEAPGSFANYDVATLTAKIKESRQQGL